MKLSWKCALLFILSLGLSLGLPLGLCAQQHKADDLVELITIDPTIKLDIRYATKNNFTHQQVYPSARCLLRRAAAESLHVVQSELKKQGLSLKVYDGYRPLSVQKIFWGICPDDRYVANPAKGSRHNRGAAVDLTIIDRKGRELKMPTPFDDFTEKAGRSYMKLPKEALQNRALLEKVMTKHGFVAMPSEWWHFDFRGWDRFPIMDEPIAP